MICQLVEHFAALVSLAAVASVTKQDVPSGHDLHVCLLGVVYCAEKRSQPTSTPAAAAAPASAAAAGGSKKPRSSSAAAAAAATPVAEPAAARKPAKTKQQQQAAVQAAAVALSGGAKPARKSAAAAAAGHDSAAVGPTEFDGLVRDVCQAALKQSEKVGRCRGLCWHGVVLLCWCMQAMLYWEPASVLAHVAKDGPERRGRWFH